jgi:hypothetical protein
MAQEHHKMAQEQSRMVQVLHKMEQELSRREQVPSKKGKGLNMMVQVPHMKRRLGQNENVNPHLSYREYLRKHHHLALQDDHWRKQHQL